MAQHHHPRPRLFLFPLHHHDPAVYRRMLHLMTSGLLSREEERGRAKDKWAYQSHAHPNLNSSSICNWIIFIFRFSCDLNFSNDCALDFVKNKLWTYCHFSERLINQENHKSLPKSVSIHCSVILSIMNHLKFYF